MLKTALEFLEHLNSYVGEIADRKVQTTPQFSRFLLYVRHQTIFHSVFVGINRPTDVIVIRIRLMVLKQS